MDIPVRPNRRYCIASFTYDIAKQRSGKSVEGQPPTGIVINELIIHLDLGQADDTFTCVVSEADATFSPN